MKSFACCFAFLVVIAPHVAFLDEPICAGQTNGPIRVAPVAIQYTVIATAGPNGSVSPGQITVNAGADLIFTATPDAGYEVALWELDGNAVQQGDSTFTISQIDADHRISVTFKQRQYTLLATAGPDGSVSPDSVTVDSGADVTFTANPDTGYEIESWSVDGVVVQGGGESHTLTNVQADHRIHVTFQLLQYTVTATAGPNGFVHPDEVTVGYNEEATFTAAADPGYAVDRWELDGTVYQDGGTTCTVSMIDADYSLHVTFRKALAYSLDDLDFDDDEEFESRVITNNAIDAEQPEESRVHVERVVGVGPEPGGVMVMYNLKDIDPASENYGLLINARVKGIFARTGADRILIRFKYLFATSEPGAELRVYLSDVPELLAPNDLLRAQHYLEVARVPAPPFPRPGSAGSGRFAIFKEVVWTGHLNFTERLYIELELVEPPQNGIVLTSSVQTIAADQSDTILRGASNSLANTALLADSGASAAYIDSWSPAVQCYGICLDINWDNFVDEADFLMVVGGCGQTATGEMACMDGALSADGYMDSYDVVSWDWALNSEQRLLNYCGVPLVSGGASVGLMSAAVAGPAPGDVEVSGAPLALVDLPANLSGLLIAGKSGAPDAHSKLQDRLYLFDADGAWAGTFGLASDRCNVKLLQGPSGELYRLNCETGLLQLDSTDKVVIPSGEVRLIDIKEPRYNTGATVYVGIQNKGGDSFGRPLLDAAFDAEFVYVVPVVVDPDGAQPYTAAAKLKLLDSGNPPYEVVTLYDDPPPMNDNQYRNSLRELELDAAGNLYVLNVHALNESDILWRYAPDGTRLRLDLGRPDSGSYIPAPVGMFASKAAEMLYLASAMSDPADSDSTVIYGFSTQGTPTLEKRITIDGLHHVTCMTEDPDTGTLWVAGFNMYNIPVYPNPTQQAFYYPYVAKILYGSDQARRIALYDPGAHDLALPMSILWTGVIASGVE